MLWLTEDQKIANRLLLTLPQLELRRLQPLLEHVDMARGDPIYEAGAPVKYIYFLNRGLISLVRTMRDGRTVEIGIVGNEGMTGSYTLFGIDNAVMDAMVQIPGSALRISRKAIRNLADKSAIMRDMVGRYAHFEIGAIAQTAACNRLHSLEERCCRWLLIGHDSALSDTFLLTHEFLAMMLGVQRPAVSLTASILQKAGLITYSRGHITISNRPGIEACACECYVAMQHEFERLFGTTRRSLPRARA